MSKNKLSPIFNHYSPSLSELDILIAKSVPPGGNWKNIPSNIPSIRIKKIRESFLAGQGSRSTYYGRLKKDAPSYTINTYFGRPGNGCHLHYDYDNGQHRVLSHREAARLQSFPDSFEFIGGKGSVATQIGNAVPVLLAYQIAKQIPFQGQYIDLFSGAGGLSLGFKWAGWEPILGTDFDKNFLLSYSHNIHNKVLLGDIRDTNIINQIVDIALKARAKNPNVPLFILGGPPCQGFSTAGNKRSMEDERNWLFKQYKEILDRVEPDGFIFENVTGLLSMQKGQVFEMIQAELSKCAKSLNFWKLNAEEYGVPQRRTRVVLYGDSISGNTLSAPEPLTFFSSKHVNEKNLPIAISVHDALSDLPSLIAGQDGSELGYISNPSNNYQKLMRSMITPEKYISDLKREALEAMPATSLAFKL